MGYRLVLDENVEHEVGHRLENYGHDVEHVDFVPSLGKGTDDAALAQYSLDTDRVIVTYDDDFVLHVDEDDYPGVLYFSDAALSVNQVADIVNAVSKHYPGGRAPGASIPRPGMALTVEKGRGFSIEIRVIVASAN